MYKMKLFGVIDEEFFFFGSDDVITLSQVQNEIKEANGQDLEVDFSSIGGIADIAVDILLEFRDYKRQFPQSQMILNIKSQCASAGSMIASGEFWDIITVEDISSWMIHNPSNFIGGDYRIMRKNAEHLERVADLYSTIYQKKSGKPEKQIRKMMDDTTFFFGPEIVAAGFADEILKTNSDTNKSTALAMLDIKHKEIMKKSRDMEIKEKDYEKVAAIMKKENQSSQPAQGGNNNNQEEITMQNSNELFEKFPTVHAETLQAGEKTGRDSILKNNASLMEMKKSDEYKDIPEVQTVLDESISKGRSIDETNPLIMAVMVKIMNDPKRASMMRADADSAGDISNGEEGTISGESGDMTDAEMKKSEKKNEEW